MPKNALEPSVLLASQMHDQPGVYALLLGSGVSTGAEMPTAWKVVTELVRRVAAATSPGDETAGDKAAEDPQAWWEAHHDSELGYSTLLEALGNTPAVRQGLLREFFEPTEDERARGIKTPSKAHKAIAELVKRGYVKVILTTNFDRLMEQALDEIGVPAQVISRPEAVAGMQPLAHAGATVIKIHGDYLDLGTRNTELELSDYPVPWMELLAQIFGDYGLVISGWSGEYDLALIKALETSPNRRYPLYWDKRSSKGTTAQRLLTSRSGQVIDSPSADDMFNDLVSSLDALERLSAPPLTTAMAVSRLKQYLADPTKAIDLHDLVMNEAERVADFIGTQPLVDQSLDWVDIEELWETYVSATTPLATLIAVGIWHDDEGKHNRLWADALHRLIVAALHDESHRTQVLEDSRFWPALLLFTAAGTAAVARHRDDVFLYLATRPKAKSRRTDDWTQNLIVLYPELLLRSDVVNNLPRTEGKKFYPASHLLKRDLRPLFADLIPDTQEYDDAFHGLEYRLSLLYQSLRSESYLQPNSGEYLLAFEWLGRNVTPAPERRFFADLGEQAVARQR